MLQDISDQLLEDDLLDHKQKADLEQIGIPCRKLAKDLKEAIAKYQVLDNSGTSLKKRVKGAWRKLTFEPADIRDLRDRISSNFTALNAYLSRVTK